MQAHRQANFTLKDEIAAYWSARSETFDRSPGHGMRTAEEREAWAALFREHLPPGAEEVLELASGTGQVTRVLLDMGLHVTGIDIAEGMIAKARARHAGAAARVRFVLGDAERTMMPDGRVDAVLSRHLVWTLTEPQAAFRDWWRVLRPGGRVVIVDGDWVRRGLVARLCGLAVALWDRLDGSERLWDAAAHARIMQRLPFRDGLRVDRVRAMLEDAGFRDIRQGSLARPYRAQNRASTLKERLSLRAWRDHSFIISAARP